MRNFVSVLIVSLVSLSVVAADDLSQLVAKAMAGDATAQYQLATKYASGNGVARDPDTAFAWYEKAARQGHRDAMYSLAISYYNGTILGGSVARDPEKAWIFFSLAAQKGDSQAQTEAERVGGELGNFGLSHARYRLALTQLEGAEVPRDIPHGLQLLESIAAQGDQEADLMLASAYQYGSYGLPIDGTKVEYWLRQALGRDVTGAVKLRLVDLYLDGRLVRKDLDAAQQLCAAMVQSRQGLMCMARVAEYREPPDEKAATEWYKKAAEAGDVRGIIQYGTALAQGRGVKQDYAKAYYWLSIASKASTFTDFKKTLDEVTAQLSPKEIAKQDKAVERLHIRPPVQKAAATKP